MIARLLRRLIVSEDLGSITLDQRRLDQATDFTAQELEGAIVSVTKVEAWQVKREARIAEMNAREAAAADTLSGARKVLKHQPRPSPVTRNGAA